MTTWLRRMTIPVLVAIAALTIASEANAYTFRVVNQTFSNITYINLHTVSNFCHDVEWKGRLKPGTTIRLNSASICLVDSIEIWTDSGTRFWRSYPGLTGYNWGVSNDKGIFEIQITR
jgi:hypothetical protein